VTAAKTSTKQGWHENINDIYRDSIMVFSNENVLTLSIYSIFFDIFKILTFIMIINPLF